MKLFRILYLGFLQLSFTAAKSSNDDRFQQYYSKIIASTPLKLDDYTYSKLTATPRDYSVAILLTAIDRRFGCQLCRDFDSEWDLLSMSWTKGDRLGESRIIFAKLDFSEGRNTFQSLGLQTAPVLLLFQPTQGPHAISDISPLRFDFTSGPHSAEKTHSWITRHLHNRPHPPIQRPIDWSRVSIIAATTFSVVTFISVAWPYVVPIIQSRNLWAAVSLILILLFTSGHMYNHIRKVPYVSSDGKGGVVYFAGGPSIQFGLETQIIASMYGLLSFATISLALKVPRVSHPQSQQVAVVAWNLVIFLMYSLLLKVFRIKNGGYPFSLPPFQ